MPLQKTRLLIDVEYDDEKTDPESLAEGFEKMWKAVWDLAGKDFVEDYGATEFKEFRVDRRTLPMPDFMSMSEAEIIANRDWTEQQMQKFMQRYTFDEPVGRYVDFLRVMAHDDEVARRASGR